MALDESQRHALHQALDHALGAGPAVLLMSQMPTMNWDQVATKDDLETLRVGILADLRGEMLTMTHKLYFGMAGIVFTAVSLSFVAARFGA
jgi:hypothetical protein